MPAPIKPMLASPGDGLPANPREWALEGKFDGWRALVAIGMDGEPTLYGGRNGNAYTGKLPYLEQAIAGALPPGTVIDGELFAAAGTAGAVQSIMAAGSAHQPTPFSPALTLVVFDVVRLNDNDVTGLPWENRRTLLDMLALPNFTSLSPAGEATLENHVKMLDLGLEGSVLKRRDARYTPGKSPNWIKLKAIDTEDCVIIGIKPGEGESNQGQAGAFEVELPSGVCTTIKVPTDAMVAEVTADPLKFVGEIVEVAHNGIMASGKPRHPRFKMLRKDKPAQPVPAPTTPTPAPRPRRPTGPAMRNYGRMNPSKLRDCLSELNGGFGDAYQRVMAGRYKGDLSEHIAAATTAARQKGLL